jgi:hypothetical protein
VSYEGLLPIKIFKSGHRVDSVAYQECLDECLAPYVTEDHVFQQDNCSVHVSHSTRHYLLEKKIELLKWPARSPDLNIVENLWTILSRKMYAGGKRYTNLVQLEAAIRKAFSEVMDRDVINLYESMPRRLMKVASKSGNIIDY